MSINSSSSKQSVSQDRESVQANQFAFPDPDKTKDDDLSPTIPKRNAQPDTPNNKHRGSMFLRASTQRRPSAGKQFKHILPANSSNNKEEERSDSLSSISSIKDDNKESENYKTEFKKTKLGKTMRELDEEFKIPEETRISRKLTNTTN